MSLALNVEAGARRGAGRMASSLAAAMCATLSMSAWTGWQHADAIGADPRRWWLPLACVVACLGCYLSWRIAAGTGARQARRGRPGSPGETDEGLRLVVAPDGAAAIATAPGEEAVPAEVVGAWHLGGVLFLRLRPAGSRRDRRLLLTRADVAPEQWHGLRRWQVWLRRSLNAHRTNARSA